MFANVYYEEIHKAKAAWKAEHGFFGSSNQQQQYQQKRIGIGKDESVKIFESQCDSGANIFIFAYKQISAIQSLSLPSSLLFIVLVRFIVSGSHEQQEK